MRLLSLLCVLLCFSATAQFKIPADIIAPEDAAFNAVYANRPIPKVTGKLLNISAGELKNLQISYTLVTPFGKMQSKKSTLAKPDGSFSLTLDHAFPYQQIWLSVGELFYAGIYANRDLYVELDMKKIKAAQEVSFIGNGVRYLGTDGRLNVYLNNYELYKREEKIQLTQKINDLVYYHRIDFTDSVVSIYNNVFDSLKNIESSYVTAHPSEYAWVLENERTSEYYSNLCTKYTGKRMGDSLWQKIKQHKGYLTSNYSMQFYQYLTTYIRYLPGASISATWKDVAALTDLNTLEKALIDSLQESEKKQPAYTCTTEDVQKWITQLKPNIKKITRARYINIAVKAIDSVFNTAKADYLKLRITSSNELIEQKEQWEGILKSMRTPWCVSVAKKEYSITSKNLMAINNSLSKSVTTNKQTNFGKPIIETAFGATLYKAPSMPALGFLAKLKQNFPGKAIIIDRWATWCAPCLAEMPHSKQLQMDAKNMDVVFVYLCTINASTEANWKTKVVELQQPGVHFLIDEALDADISKYFSFSGYPGYALLDKTGKYKPGAFTRITDIADAKALEAIINK